MKAVNALSGHIALRMLMLVGLVFSLIFIASTPLRAELASDQEMQQVAENWLTYIVAETGGWAGELRPEISYTEDLLVNDTLLGRYYIISSGGYILVPALRELPPIKAYTDESNIEDIYATDGFMAMLREVLKARMDVYIETFGSLEASQPAGSPLYGIENSEAWDRFAVSAKQFADSYVKTLNTTLDGLGPLTTTSWHQGSPYNTLCPMGDGGRCVVGCVATAAAQIIYYHQWPPAGEGSHTYHWNGDNSCDGSTSGANLSADFSDEYTYDNSNASVAEISYEMGVAFDMDYGYCGSGAYTLNGSWVLPQYFRYDNSAQSIYRSSYTAQNWFNVIVDQINQYHPTLYRISGHAIVCDGWRISGTTNQVHMNYGWGGSQNAWYAVDNLHCDWSGCDPMVEGMVINIIPLSGSPWLGTNDFDDGTGGDGDGILEGGETIELVVMINNYGGGDVTDVTATLTIDDANLTIVDGSASFGNIPGRDSASNASNPFIFTIPAEYIPRVDSFMIELSWNSGAEVDTMVIEQAVGGSTILLVDDDDLGGVEQYYVQTLSHFRSPYDIWTQSYYVPPDSAYLSRYDMVIWFTGDLHYAPINAAEITSIKGYLNQGGSLVLTGQGIAEFLNLYDQTFLNTYLKTQYTSTGYVPLLTSVSGCEIMDLGDTVVIYGTGGAGNQTDPDHIEPINGSITELYYFGTTQSGAVSYNGADYKLAFFGFGLEALRSTDERFITQDTMMSYLFDYFNYTAPETAPIVVDPSIGPGDKMHLTDHTPEISWVYTDKNGYTQSMYQVQVSSNTDWSTIEMWDTDAVSGSESSVTYAGLPLVDGSHYYVRIRVFNGSFWSSWSYTDMILNALPAQPTPASPAEMASVISTMPTLTVNSVVDPEGDDVTYGFEVYSDAGLTSLVTSVSAVPSQAGTTGWQVDAALSEDQVYYWRTRADDEYEVGDWTGAASFWVNADNQLPAAFGLVSPANASTLDELAVTFVWNSTTDADPFDELNYTLHYDVSESFATATIVSGLTDTTYTLSEPLAIGYTYYWNVTAVDGSGGATTSPTFSALTIIPGDANGDQTVNVGDAVYLINFIFNSGPAPNPLIAGDANCDSTVNVGDAVYLITYIFRNGPPPGCNE
ncbi:MAG: C10 family peptidase [Candidatus Zixiibacteriota bacterium]